ncbi:MAG TPA: metalloregulator ArsR/SmtB family transcription factor [Nitrospirota bacterium]|nr:metalloregulator ArsR/SmtB family transcription factor [Nitrospirota bacterium]
MNDKFREAAEFLKAAGHPARLEILSRLASGVLCVSDMGEVLGAAQPNISQHLAVLRRSGIVDYYVDGKQRCYFLKDARALEVVSLVKKKRASLPAPSCCPATGTRRGRARAV